MYEDQDLNVCLWSILQEAKYSSFCTAEGEMENAYLSTELKFSLKA